MSDAAQIDEKLADVLAGKPEPVPEGFFGEEAVSRICDRIGFHGIAGFLHANERARSCWPDAVADFIQRENARLVLWEELHQAVVQRAIAAFSARNVPATLLKGSALAYSHYRHPALRARGDTDLLVAERDLATARTALRDAGLRCIAPVHGVNFQESWVLRTTGAVEQVIDLHWRIVDSPRLHGVLQTSEVISRTVPLGAFGALVSRPSDGDLLLHGILNQEWHARFGVTSGDMRVRGAKRLIWLMDNHLLFGAMNSDAIAALAQTAIRRGCAPWLACALEDEMAIFGGRVDTGVLAALREADASTPVTHYLASKTRISRVRSDWRAVSGFRESFRFILRELFPPATHLRAQYPHSAGWPVSALHLRRLASGLRRVVTRS